MTEEEPGRYPSGTSEVRTRPLVIAIASCLGFAFLARALAPPPEAQAWVMQLERPDFAAPILLVLLMGVFYYLVFGTLLYRAQVHIAPKDGRGAMLGLLYAILAFGAVWNAVFVRLESTVAGAAGAALMAFLFGILAWGLASRDRTSFYLLLPYLAWVLYDLAWSLGIWQLNP